MKYSEENIFAMLRQVGIHAGCPVLKRSNFRQIQVGDHHWPNLCFDITLDQDMLDLEIDEIRNRVEQGQTPPVFMCGPGKAPEKTLTALKAAASGHVQWAAMTLGLEKWTARPQDSALEVIHVTQKEAMEDWCRISNESLVGSAKIQEHLFMQLQADPAFGFFLARWKGKAVGTCMSFTHNEKAGLYLVATLRKWRGKGFGKLIAESAIDFLKAQGVGEIHLQATPSGEAVYHRIGFTKYGDIDVFDLG